MEGSVLQAGGIANMGKVPNAQCMFRVTGQKVQGTNVMR